MADLNKNNILQTHITDNIQNAFGALKYSFAAIPKLFTGKDLCVINCQNDGKNGKLMEISFNAATLTCHFNKDNICYNAYLYLDDLGDLQHYVDYFNQVYKFDPTCQAWVSDKGCICLEADGMDCYLSLQSFDAKRY